MGNLVRRHKAPQSEAENATNNGRPCAESLGGQFVDTGHWKAAKFQTQGLGKLIPRSGYTRGAFGIARVRDYARDWGLFHLPTGLAFPWSYWQTMHDAREFGNALIRIESWENLDGTDRRKQFYAVLEDTGRALGYPPRILHRIT